jgi:hypothetical protein
MARQRDYKRLSRRARHLIHRLRHTKHASVQNVTVNELDHDIHRSRYGRAASSTATPPDGGRPGHWRPLNHRAKRLLTELRRTKVWAVQRRLVKELVAEMGKGRRRVADRVKRLKPSVPRALRSRNSWAVTARSWKPARPVRSAPGPARRPGVRTAPSRRAAPAPRPAGRLAPGARPAPARTPARTRT